MAFQRSSQKTVAIQAVWFAFLTAAGMFILNCEDVIGEEVVGVVKSADPAPAPIPSPITPTQVEVSRVEGSTIYFNQGQLTPLKTSFFDLELLGVLRHPQQRLPYLLLSGASCRNCAVAKMLVLLRADGKFPLTLVYPGRIRDRKNSQTVFEGRAFYGECIAGKAPVYVMYQKERVDRRKFLQQSAFVAEVEEHGIDERLIVRHMPSLTQVLKGVKKKRCFEIAGFERQSVKFSIQKVKPEELEIGEDADGEADSKLEEKANDKKTVDPVEADPQAPAQAQE
jgi:hypothetical protein